MTDLEAMLRAVLADPDDDQVRLIYADCLEDCGEGDRAEFIRVQLEIERLMGIVEKWVNTPSNKPGGTQADGGAAGESLAKADSLRRRERELLANPRNFVNWTPREMHTGSGAGIVAPGHSPVVEMIGIGFKSATFHRGFIAQIECIWPSWTYHADAILAQHPIRKVVLTSWPDVDRRVDAKGVADLLKAAWPRIEFELPQYGPSPLRDLYPQWLAARQDAADALALAVYIRRNH